MAEGPKSPPTAKTTKKKTAGAAKKAKRSNKSKASVKAVALPRATVSTKAPREKRDSKSSGLGRSEVKASAIAPEVDTPETILEVEESEMIVEMDTPQPPASRPAPPSSRFPGPPSPSVRPHPPSPSGRVRLPLPLPSEKGPRPGVGSLTPPPPPSRAAVPAPPRKAVPMAPSMPPSVQISSPAPPIVGRSTPSVPGVETRPPPPLRVEVVSKDRSQLEAKTSADTAAEAIPAKRRAKSPHPPKKSMPPPRREMAQKDEGNSGHRQRMAFCGELSTRAYEGVAIPRAEEGKEVGDREGAARDLISHCLKSLKLTKDPQRRSRLHYEIGRLTELDRSKLGDALNHYRKSHSLDQGYEPTVAGLIRVCSMTGQWEGTLSFFDEQVALTATPEGKAGLLFSKAAILESRLGRPNEARADFERALKLVPNDASLLRAAVRCARRADDFSALDTLLASQSELSGDDGGFAAAYMSERARVAEQYRNNPDQAVQFYQKSFELDPLASNAALALERLYALQGNTREQIALLSKRAGLVRDPRSRASAMATAGSLLADTLGEPAEAAQYYEEAWEAQPESSYFLRELEELYRRCGDFSGVVRVLERQEQQSQNGPQRAALCVTIAEVLHRRLGQHESAVVYWERAREVSPALSSCVEPLIAYYELKEDWSQLVKVLIQEEKASGESSRRAAIHSRLAVIAEQKVADSRAAIEHYRAALALASGDENAIRELSRLLEESSRYEELIDIHQRAADTADEDAVAFVHLFKIGQVFEDLLREPERALPIYRLILDREPGHLGALFSFQRAAERASEYSLLVDSLVEEVGVVKGAARKVPLLHRAALICEKSLAQEQRAIKLYTEAITLDPSHSPTLDCFSLIHEKGGRYPELLKVLTLKLACLSGSHPKAALLFRMGRICEERLRQDDTALGYYRKSLETDPEVGPVVLGVERCLTRLDRFEELAAFLTERVKNQSPGAERAELAFSLGRVCEMRLEKMGEALSAYEVALSDVPDLELALDGRVRVLERRKDPTKAAQAHLERAAVSTDRSVRLWARLRAAVIYEGSSRNVDQSIETYQGILGEHPHQAAALEALERLYESRGRDGEQLRILSAQVESLSLKHNQVGALREILRLEEPTLSEVESPSSSSVASVGKLPEGVEALLERCPGDRPALRFAELFALLRQNFETLALVDECFGQITSQGHLASAHQTRLGDHLEGGNPVRALTRHQPALVLDQESIGSARGVSRVAEIVGDPALLSEAAELERQVVGDDSRSAALLIRAATLQGEKGNLEEAVVSLKRALTIHPDSVEAGAALHRLLFGVGRYEELGAALSTAAHASRSSKARVYHWSAVAKLLADQNDDLSAAIAALHRIDNSRVKSLACSLDLASLLLRDRQWKALAEELQNATKLSPSSGSLLAIRLSLAEVYHEHLGQSADATRELTGILEAHPEQLTALRRLLTIQMKERSKAALSTAQSLAKLAEGPEQAEAHLALGVLYSSSKKPDKAKKPFAAAIALLGLEPPEAADGLRAILIKEGGGPESWALYTNALMTFCADSTPGEHQARAYLELGRTLAGRQGSEKEAVEALTFGLAKNKNSLSLQRELFSRLKGSARYQEALPHVLALLHLLPFDAELWSDLAEVYDALGRGSESVFALGPVVLLKRASREQKAKWSARKPQPALLGEGAFGLKVLEATFADHDSGEALALLGQLTGPLSKVFPPDLAALGASSRNKVGAKGHHPCRPILDRICSCFGDIEIDLYPSGSAAAVHVVATDPVGLVVPTSLGEASEVEQVFVLGRFAANIARHVQAVDLLSEEELRLVLAASVSMVEFSPSDPTIDAQELVQLTKRLVKAMPWLSKGRIEDAARHYGSAPLEDLGSFRRELWLSSFRTALVLADDVSPLFGLSQGVAEMMGVEVAEIESLLSQLMPYWASPEAMDLRRRLKVL